MSDRYIWFVTLFSALVAFALVRFIQELPAIARWLLMVTS